MSIERHPITSREQWLELRKADVTASDVAAVCGEGMYGSAAKVWAEKRGIIPPAELNEAMKRGHWGEAAVFEALQWERPTWELRRAKVYFRDPDARLGATPDGAAIIPGREGVCVIQAKVVASPVFKRDWLVDAEDDVERGEAAVPLGYQLQTTTENMLAGATIGILAALVVDTFKWTLRTFEIERHAGAETMIREKVAAFWKNYLDPGVQPPLEAERDDELVKLLYPRDDGTTVDLSSSNRFVELLEQREKIKVTLSESKDKCVEIETEIKAMLGEHTYGKAADGRVASWKLQNRNGYEVAPTSFRMLRVVKPKAKETAA